MPKLSDAEITRQLQQIAGWEYKDNAISKLYRFGEFLEGIRFIDKVAEMAEAADHHPDIHVNYTRVTFVCSTHSDGGVTDKDIRLATQIEQAFRQAGHS
jgi:4a-hydroxytetrahydrobiopterin dehydratase